MFCWKNLSFRCSSPWNEAPILTQRALQRLYIGFQAKHKTATEALTPHPHTSRQTTVMTHRLIKAWGSLRISQNRCLIFVPMCRDMLTYKKQKCRCCCHIGVFPRQFARQNCLTFCQSPPGEPCVWANALFNSQLLKGWQYSWLSPTKQH